MSGLRILHVIPSISPNRGGPSTVVESLARGQARAGCRVTIATTDDDGPAHRSDRPTTMGKEDGVDYKIFPRQTRFYTISRPLRKWLRENLSQFDVVHVHALFSYPPVVAARLAHQQGVPYIVRPLGTLERWGLKNRRPFLKSLSLRTIETQILARAAAVHYTTQREADEGAKLGVGHRPVIVPNPVELPDGTGSAKSGDGSAPSERRILFLSRIDPKKGLEILLEAFAQLQKEGMDARLLVAGAGDGDYVDKLKLTSDRLGLRNAIEWLGHADEQEKIRLLELSDVFVLPSFSENFGVSVVEAMLAALPVVVTTEVGVADDIAANRAGLVVEPDSAALSEALRTILEDETLARELGRRGQHLAAEKFSTTRVTSDLLALYEDVALSSSRRS